MIVVGIGNSKIVLFSTDMIYWKIYMITHYANIATDSLVSENILMQMLLAEFQTATYIAVADLATALLQ